ncbi:MAG: extracellular solute-binding protein [Flexilinea sp.]|nr:extracellular solute-binding protein [Flexilinea sp.]
MKKLTVLLLMFCIVLSLVSIVPAAADTPALDTKAVLEVNIWDNNQLKGLRQIADDWTAETGVKVNINVISWIEYWTLLSAGAFGGQLPDVFWMHINEAQNYMWADLLLNLNPYIESDDAIDLDNYYEGIVGIYNLNGNQFALPKDHDTIALLYNKSIFDINMSKLSYINHIGCSVSVGSEEPEGISCAILKL